MSRSIMVAFDDPEIGVRWPMDQPQLSPQGYEEVRPLSDRCRKATAVSSGTMSTLIFGAKGMLGRALREWLDMHKRPYIPLGLPELDITDEKAVVRVLEYHRASVVINCAAYTRVDGAERDEATALRVSGTGCGTSVR